jgi:hypothetical protein
MLIRSVLIATLIATVAGTAVHAAPATLDVSDYKTIDRWVEIFDPGQLVGPEIDPDNPLHISDVVEFDPQPEPPKAEVEIVVIKR